MLALFSQCFILNAGGGLSLTPQGSDPAATIKNNIQTNTTPSSSSSKSPSKEVQAVDPAVMLSTRDEEVCYHRTHNVNMCLEFKALNALELRLAKHVATSVISKFKSVFGITKSRVEHRCEIHKKLYNTKIQDSWLYCGFHAVYNTENTNLWLCSIHAMFTGCLDPTKPNITEESDFKNNTLVHELTHALVFYRTEGKRLSKMFDEGMAEYISLNNEGIMLAIEYSYEILIEDHPNMTASDLFNDTGIIMKNRYYNSIGPVLVKYIHELSYWRPSQNRQQQIHPQHHHRNPNILNNYMNCVRSSDRNRSSCVDKEILPVLNDSSLTHFRDWITKEFAKNKNTPPPTTLLTTATATAATTTTIEEASSAVYNSASTEQRTTPEEKKRIVLRWSKMKFQISNPHTKQQLSCCNVL